MSSITPYNEAFSVLKNIYLEDSWVLGVNQRESTIAFDIEFVLTENHEFYRKPDKDEKYCYNKGKLYLSGCADKALKLSGSAPAIDANGENDFGNIDVFSKQGNTVELEGDWGHILTSYNKVSIELDANSVSES